MRNTLTFVSCAAIAAVLGSPLTSHAAIINNAVNGSFEDFPISGAPNGVPANGQSPFYVLYSGSAALTGWTVTKGSVDLVPNNLWSSQSGLAGTYSVDLVGTPKVSGDPTPQTGGISQTVTGLTVGDTYEFSFWYSVNPGTDSYSDQNKNKILDVSVTSSNGEGTSTLYHPAPLVLTRGTRTFTSMQWKQVVADFVAPSSSLTIAFQAMLNDGEHPTSWSTNDVLTGPVIDTITLADITTGIHPPTPEPASLGVLGAGTLLLAARRRRQA